MGIKQRECFCPWMIGCFGLQPVAEAARECKEFADLFSKTRGANRHKTIVRILTELLPSHPKVKEVGFEMPKFEYYCKWVNNPDSLLSNEGLKQAIAKSNNPQEKAELEVVLGWSKRVNQAVADIVKNVAPFRYVCESWVKGKMYYFGSDKKEVLQRYLNQATYLHGCQENLQKPTEDQMTLRL